MKEKVITPLNLLMVAVTLVGIVLANGRAYAAEGIYTDNSVSYYEDGQGVTYGFNDDGTSCYVKGFTDNIVANVVIPEKITMNDKQYTVTVIGEKAFYWCEVLKTIELPDSITSIKRKAFWSSGLTELTIPKNVTELVDTSINCCVNLPYVTIAEDNPMYSADGQGCVYNKDKTVLIFALGMVDEVIIPKTVKTIGEYAFYDTQLTKVTIPNSVKKIEDSAFGLCTNLKTLLIPNSVKTIEGWAFGGCDKLTKIKIGKNVTTIGKYAFENCFQLKSIIIQSTKLKSIGEGAFSKDKNLKSVTIKTTKLTKTKVGANAFKGTNKKLVIKVPKNKVNSYKKFLKTKGNKKVIVSN